MTYQIGHSRSIHHFDSVHKHQSHVDFDSNQTQSQVESSNLIEIMESKSKTKVKVFGTIKFYMQLMGILEWQLENRYKKIPFTLIQRISILGCITISAANSFLYCIFKANETYEFIETLYFALGFTLFVILYTIALWHRDRFIHFFGTIEETIQNREYL